MFDPYAVLGVDKSADKVAIKKAYQRAAKKAHPDHGGNAERFGAITRARDILTDDARRARYDATGDASEKSPDNAFSTAINVVAGALSALLAECAGKGQSPLEIDVAECVRTKLRNNVAEIHKQIRIHEGMVEYDRQIIGRLKVKKGKQNILADIMRHRIAMLEQTVSNMRRNIIDHESALSYVEGTSFKADAPSYYRQTWTVSF